MPVAIMKSAALALVLISARLGAQPSTQPQPTPDTVRARRGSEFLIPASSFLLPGLGQYLQHAPRAGVAYTATFIAGAAVGGPTDVADVEDLPRSGDDQLSDQGWHVASTSIFLSSWDAFHRAVPALRHRGKYQFLPPREKVGQLVSAPFDVRFLKRWTTWVDLGQTAVITAIVISERERGGRRVPFRGHDAAYAASASLNAGVGEEAFFRGYLLPLFYQHTGQQFWVADALQGGLFGAAHLPDASWFALEIAGWAMWEGWVVRRNEWSIRESIFHHFWYDAAVISAEMATQKARRVYRITLPSVPF
jgi:hypothetical protein